MKAIDLYAGIGGWSAGLACAGIEIVDAYEIWPAALRTYNANLGTSHGVTDVRQIALEELPKDISLVVGSPPCTQFSFSNRGGSGDFDEGLKDITRFFEAVDHIKPDYWLMENVPRVAAMVREGLRSKGHALYRFRHLEPKTVVVDFASFGLPQSRARCLVGVFPFDRLASFSRRSPLSLGEVITALARDDVVTDPIWGLQLDHAQLTEMEPEPALNAEQLRMNREAKRFHPVYNDMPFPDVLNRPSRTVTATCTRVSRESIVVADPDTDSVRRLTVRERATLQGFPITYQFFGGSHSQKVKMIGNAVPPYFAYLVGAAAQGWKTAGRDRLKRDAKVLSIPATLPEITPPHAVGTAYPSRRRFRAALPGLRFKSGMRFQLSNVWGDDVVAWSVSFFFGPSKAVESTALDDILFGRLATNPMVERILRQCRPQLEAVSSFMRETSPFSLQERWCQRAHGAGPYQLADLLGHAAVALTSAFATVSPSDPAALVLTACKGKDGFVVSKRKLVQNAPAVLAGLLLGSWFNRLPWGLETARNRKEWNLVLG